MRFQHARGPATRWSLAAGLAALIGVGAPAFSQDGDRKQQIEQVESKLKELTAQLEALRKSEAEAAAPAQPTGLALKPEWVKSLAWRPIGPAAMGGRITALSVYEADPSLYYVATAGGGLLKTTNNGVTFEHQFDREATVSIGDVAVAQSNKDIVWIGTGEGNPRNSVSYGDGVYKSTDGGKSWARVGLEKSFQIGRIAVHPTNPDVVYVGALGRLYGPSEERGLFKTTDGGKSWEKVLFVDDRTGVIDLRMHPTDPETLIVATYERRRDEFDGGDPEVKFGAGSGLHKTTDGGKTWKKLANGLPTVKLGRIGIDWYRKDPNVVFAIIDSEKVGTGPAQPAGTPTPGSAYVGIQGEDTEGGARLMAIVPEGPAEKAGLKEGDVVTGVGEKAVGSYEDLLATIREAKPGDKVNLKVKRDDQPVEVEVELAARPAGQGGGRGEPGKPFGAQLGGQVENAQARQGDEGFQTGGVYRSADGGESWTRINSLNPRPMYFSQVRVDPSDEKFLYVLGVALYRSSDGGAKFTGDGGRSVHADHHALWIDPKDGRHQVVGTDGGFYVTYDRMDNWDHLNHQAIGQFYHVAIDARRRYSVYGGLQDNGSWGGPSTMRGASGPINEDWIRIGSGDGFKCQVDQEDPDQLYYTSQYGALGRRNLRTGEQASIRPQAERGRRLRWNWSTPFLLSSHNPRIYYAAANYVFRSLDKGDDLRAISPEVTRTDKGSATALAESPRDPNVVYVGTDDGYVWATKDGGAKWENLTEKFKLPGSFYVATIEASRSAPGRAYAAFDAHRSNDDNPYVFVTEDYGQTWKSIVANLPWGSTRCLREDVTNSDLLYCGTEFGIWASLDRGLSWTKVNGNLPTVAVHEIAVHPTAGEIVAATHGRSLWVLDVTPLRQSTKEVVTADAHLFKPIPAVRWRGEPGRGGTNRRFEGQSAPAGAQIYYALDHPAEKVALKVYDHDGKVVRDLRIRREAGLHRATWDLLRTAPARGGGGGGGGAGGARNVAAAGAVASAVPGGGLAATIASGLLGGGPGGGGRGGLGRGIPVPPGTYRVVLTVGDKELAQSVRVEADPTSPPSEIITDNSGEEFDLLGLDQEAGDDDRPARPIDE